MRLVYMRLDPHLPKLYPRAHADVGACHERRYAYSCDLVLPYHRAHCFAAAPQQMRPLASRISVVSGEGALSVYTRAKELESQGRSIIHLELGEPDFHPATAVNEALKHAMDAGRDRYCPVAGVPALREAIAEYRPAQRNQSRSCGIDDCKHRPPPKLKGGAPCRNDWKSVSGLPLAKLAKMSCPLNTCGNTLSRLTRVNSPPQLSTCEP